MLDRGREWFDRLYTEGAPKLRGTSIHHAVSLLVDSISRGEVRLKQGGIWLDDLAGRDVVVALLGGREVMAERQCFLEARDELADARDDAVQTATRLVSSQHRAVDELLKAIDGDVPRDAAIRAALDILEPGWAGG